MKSLGLMLQVAAKGCACLAAVVVFAGCGGGSDLPPTVPVVGKVTYNSQPVGGAMVTFIGEGKARPATAMTASDGSYQLMTLNTKGAMPGSYRVVVDKTETSADLTRQISMEEAEAMVNTPPPAPKRLIPEKYADPAQTPLKFDVKESGENTIDIELTD